MGFVSDLECFVGHCLHPGHRVFDHALGAIPFLQYTGVLAFGMMSVAMILASRSVWLDRWLNGLDKMYRLHKWLGLGALIAAVTHWGTVKAPHLASIVGLTERPPRPEGGR